MISAEVIADSIAPSGVRLTTLSLKYPRFIHSEFMTHRVFSRNASSSRAIPVNRIIEDIDKDWAKPLKFHKNKRGMQGGEEFDPADQEKLFSVWEQAKNDAVTRAKQMQELGAHKQYVNRILEPFSHISVVVTATDWDNFFALRYHHMAQPEIHALAIEVFQALGKSMPKHLNEGEWHLPYVTEKEAERVQDGSLLKMSVARCARVSYNKHDGTTPTLEDDETLYERLLGAQPIHASPAEHQAMAVGDSGIRSGNFRGWVQYRKTLEGENVNSFYAGTLV